MVDNSSDDDPTAEEQYAFSEAYDLINRLVDTDGLPPVEVGTGVLIAALSCLLKNMAETEVAALLYEYADDYATRHIAPDSGA